ALCIYCLANPRETNDHIPPKGLFREPRPSNLITVPACYRCNSSFSGDDDYFLNLALDWTASESIDGKEIVAKRLRSMKRKEGGPTWKPCPCSRSPARDRQGTPERRRRSERSQRRGVYDLASRRLGFRRRVERREPRRPSDDSAGCRRLALDPR